MIILIAAINKYGVIGDKKSIPWRNKEDLKHFRETTLHKNVVMGRVTYESLPKTLDQRNVLIVSRNKDISDIPSFETFLKENEDSDTVYYIAGGGDIYRKSLPYAKKMILSMIDDTTQGDTTFPSFNLNEFFIEKREQKDTFEIIHYLRRK